MRHWASANMNRRHLTVGQRAMIAEELAVLGEGRPKTASVEAVSIPDAADLLQVSRPSVERARKVKQNAPDEIIEAVKEGKSPS